MGPTEHGTSLDEAAKRRVFLFSEDQIDLFWKDIVPLIESIPIFSDLYDPDWVYSELKMGHLQLWALRTGEVVQAITITRIGVYPRAKVFEILGTAGRRAYDFVSEMEVMFEWLAKDSDCTYFKATVREGVVRKLRNVSGVQRVGAVLMKKIVPSRAN